MTQSFGHTFAAIAVAYKSALPTDGRFHGRDRIRRCGQPASPSRGQHGQIVQVIARGKNILRRDAQPTANLSERRAFVVSRVTEPRLNVISHDDQVRHPTGEFIQVRVNFVRLTIAGRD